MADFDLFCQDCKRHTSHTILPWRTAAGVRGAVSVLCRECSRLAIAELAELLELEIPADGASMDEVYEFVRKQVKRDG